MRYRLFLLTVIFFSVFGITSIQAQHATDKEDFLGSWIANPDSVPSNNRLVLHINRAGNDSLKLNIDSPDQGVFRLQPSFTSIYDDSINFEIKDTSVRFEGKINADGSQIEGVWSTTVGSDQRSFVPLSDSVAKTLPKLPQEKRPKAKIVDVNSPAAIVDAVYDVLSEPAGKMRDWDRLRSLFLPTADLVFIDQMGGKVQKQTLTVEEYIENWRSYSQPYFREQIIHRVSERFNNIVHVFATFENYQSPDGKVNERGLTSYQLWYDGNRWWIVNLLEQDGDPIPEHYFGKSNSN